MKNKKFAEQYPELVLAAYLFVTFKREQAYKVLNEFFNNDQKAVDRFVRLAQASWDDPLASWARNKLLYYVCPECSNALKVKERSVGMCSTCSSMEIEIVFNG